MEYFYCCKGPQNIRYFSERTSILNISIFENVGSCILNINKGNQMINEFHHIIIDSSYFGTHPLF